MEGVPAPFDGVIFTHQRALNLGKIGLKLETCELTRRIELEASADVCKLKLDAAAAVRGMLVDGHRKQAEKLQAALERMAEAEAAARADREHALNQRNTWTQVGFGAGVATGVAVAVLTGVAAVWATSELSSVVIARSAP